MKPNRFLPASAYRKRDELRQHLETIQELAEVAIMRLDRRDFDPENLPYCLNQLVTKTRLAKKFYNENK